MAREFKLDLSAKGIRELKKEITHYKHQTLHECLKDTVDSLIDLGGIVAEQNIDSEFQPYIGVHRDYTDVSKYNYLYKAKLVLSNDVQNVSEWQNKDGVHTEVVNSLMMAEHGSGQFADPASYRGTFPHQKHAMQRVWFWKDLNDVVHKSKGVKATHPYIKAEATIENQCYNVAKEAFSRH